MRRAALALVAVVLALSVSACDDGPECLSGHTEFLMVPVYDAALKTARPQLMPHYVCDQYAPTRDT